MTRLFVRAGWLALLLGPLLALAACQPDPQAAAEAVQAYLEARVASDVDRMVSVSCPTWEAQARVEATSFASMNAALDGVSCSVSGTQDDYTLVSCQGKITTTYQGEAREWSVADHPFRTVLQDGEYVMCGYQ